MKTYTLEMEIKSTSQLIIVGVITCDKGNLEKCIKDCVADYFDNVAPISINSKYLDRLLLVGGITSFMVNIGAVARHSVLRERKHYT